MPSTYNKRIWQHHESRTSVYQQVVDSTPVSWSVLKNRIVRQEYTSKAAAIAFAQTLIHETQSQKETNEEFIALAESFDEMKLFVGPLDIRLLACLYIRNVASKSEINRYMLVAGLAAKCGPIPCTEAAFNDWSHKAIAAVQERSQHVIKSKRGLSARLDTYGRIMKQISAHPIAFKKWVPHVHTLLPRLKQVKRTKSNVLTEIESFQPMTRDEIASILKDCNNFEQAMIVIVYLTSGLRSGEAERLDKSHLVRGKFLNLRDVVTKTKTKRQPEASVALRIALTLVQHSERLPSHINKKKFRPTCAVNLIQSKVPMLIVMERLGHASLTMLINHYSKVVPSDWESSKDSQEYLGVGELNVGEWKCDENDWDKYCLKLLLQQAIKYDKIDDVKNVLKVLVETKAVKDKYVDSF